MPQPPSKRARDSRRPWLALLSRRAGFCRIWLGLNGGGSVDGGVGLDVDGVEEAVGDLEVDGVGMVWGFEVVGIEGGGLEVVATGSVALEVLGIGSPGGGGGFFAATLSVLTWLSIVAFIWLIGSDSAVSDRSSFW